MKPNPVSLFKGTAEYYARYRRPYPPQIFADIVAYFELDGRGKLLDLGCGTGELTLPLSKHFESAVGIDPSGDMLAEAKSKAKKENIDTVMWIEGIAEDVDESLAPVRLATTGASFHWLDQPFVLKKMHELMEQNGGMVVIDDTSPVRGREKTEDWKVKRKEIIVKYLGEERRAGDYLHKDFIPEKRSTEDLIVESPFKTFEYKEYEYTTERTIDEIIGFLRSTSYANRRLLGDQADEFEHEMRKELLALVPSNKFVEWGRSDAYFLRK